MPCCYLADICCASLRQMGAGLKKKKKKKFEILIHCYSSLYNEENRSDFDDGEAGPKRDLRNH